MKRKAHIIPKLKNMLGGLNLLFFDTETGVVEKTEKTEAIKMKLCCTSHIKTNKDVVVTYRQDRDFTNDINFYFYINSITTTQQKLHIISCNIWFDMRVSKLFMLCCENGWKVKSIYAKSMVVIIKMEKNGKNIIFLNINQFLPGSVDLYGKLLGLPKLKIDFDVADIATLIEYCRRDTEIIVKMFLFWLKFIKDNNLGGFGYTTASQSFICYRTRFMSKKIFIHNNELATNIERLSYYGGRTEIYRQGKQQTQQYYCVDVHSMYPSVMSDYKQPTKLTQIYNEISTKKLSKLLKSNFVIAKVAISTKDNYYPYRYNNKLVFPVGNFITYLCKPELEIAIENNNLVHIHDVFVYEEQHIFREFVEYFYKLKTEYKQLDNKLLEYLVKLILNSLYGKFGQRNDEIIIEEQTDKILFESNTLYDEDKPYTLRELFFGTLRKVFIENNVEAHNSFCAISSSVTSYARVKLHRYIQQAGRENVLYCDTDSLFLNQKGYDNIKTEITDSELGTLGLENVVDSLEIYAPKDYILGAKVKHKGINKLARQTSENTWDCTQFPSFKSDIRRGLDKDYIIKHFPKTLKREYTKGFVHDDGHVSPLEIYEW